MILSIITLQTIYRQICHLVLQVGLQEVLLQETLYPFNVKLNYLEIRSSQVSLNSLTTWTSILDSLPVEGHLEQK